jgi:predicted ferric reductase
MIWIAGGIGITPFLAMAKHESLYPTGRKIRLIWAVRHISDAPYGGELKKEAAKNINFSYYMWISGKMGRLDLDSIYGMIGGDQVVRESVVYLCGPGKMMHSIARGFHKRGVKFRDIYYEDFSLL